MVTKNGESNTIIWIVLLFGLLAVGCCFCVLLSICGGYLASQSIEDEGNGGDGGNGNGNIQTPSGERNVEAKAKLREEIANLEKALVSLRATRDAVRGTPTWTGLNSAVLGQEAVLRAKRAALASL